MNEKRDKMLGEILVNANHITEKQLEELLKKQDGKTLLGELVVEEGYITESELVKILESQLGIPHVNLDEYNLTPKLAGYLPEKLARRHKVVPIYTEGRTLHLAMADPRDLVALDDIKMAVSRPVKFMIAGKRKIKSAISLIYGQSGLDVNDIFSDLEAMKDENDVVEESKLLEMVERAPIIRLANRVIIGAYHQQASDIHVEPLEDNVRIRYRVDGVLYDQFSVPRSSRAALTSRFKVMADLDITEIRVPQDGRIKMKMDMGEEIDMRVSTLPTVQGEKVVIRILTRDNRLLNLNNLDFSKENKDKFLNLITKPHGILLVTGPTGSGKSTTLFAVLNYLNSSEDNIVTIEDPVEYQIKGINQVQARPKTGLTFAGTLRSILRQDPDIIMLGEIRDEDTVEVAVRAALTGHLVLSTLHTNDAVSSITRLIDMKVPPYLVSSAVIGIMAQRLVRRLCPECRIKYEPEPEEYTFLGEQKPRIVYKAEGCTRCSGKGYRGRIAVHELLPFTSELRQLISSSAGENELTELARSQGMKTLKEDGLKKLESGLTDLHELKKVIF